MSTTGSLAVSSALLRATAMTNSDDDFETLLQSTRRAFRPNNLINKPGRKKAKQFKRCVMLLRRSNVDFLPSQSEIEFLTDRGLENAIDLFEKLGQGMLVIVPNRDLPVELRLTNNMVINEVESNQINREETIIEATTQANIPRRNVNDTHTENEPFSNFIPQTRQPQLIGTAGFQAITSTSMVAIQIVYLVYSTMNDEKLIELVRGYPVLYDLCNAEYMDSHFKSAIWSKVG
ncbi:unnamed protein product [Psylliodes chrysocephalus]|uniref:Uncharacterized protein n=1 Tax=Psylliodes chrysocephalus TaxID=3402493 RepID=A0A9P0D080_9CUCU|nr:unnamed protein product [Psylliodes chrysocephala]